MNHLYQIPQPIIFAHRGASAHAPENTLAAFQLAVELGADAIELDVKLTLDKKIIVLHDQTVNRTTDAYGDVRKLLLSTVKELDAGSHFSENFTLEKIPTLEEVFDTIGHQIYINIELTNYATPRDELPELVAEMIKHHNMEDRVLISSFLRLNLARIQELLPEVPTALLTWPGYRGLLARTFLKRASTPEIIHPYHTDISPIYIKKVKSMGKRIHVWTVNSRTEIRRLLSLQVDGLFTDDPLLARSLIETK